MTDQLPIQEQSVQKKAPATIREDGYTESITLEQFVQEMLHPVKHDTEQLVTHREPAKPGVELFKQRVRVTFEFDVACNSEPILNTGNDDDVKAHDIALLKSFLMTPQLVDMLVDKIGCELGLNSPESFIQRFLPTLNTECHSLFSKAIETLTDENGKHWRGIRDYQGTNDLLSICTESIFECFSAQFVSSSYETIHTEEEWDAILATPESQAFLEALDTEALAILKDEAANE
jgi:hypothetical protein